MNRRRAAFTLIELLVVIGIILALLAILVPVVSKVRLAAQTANTTNQLHRISAAIQNYYNDFLLYPGVLENKDFTTAGNLSGKIGNGSGAFPGFKQYTQSEDLPMALLGGFQYDTGKVLLDLKPDEIGLGPMSFNKVALDQRKNAYMPKNAAELTPLVAGALKTIASQGELGMPYVTDSEAPEFMDLYSTLRPILYMRSNVAQSNANNILYNSTVTNNFRPDIFYDVGLIQPYLNPSADFPNPANASQFGFTSGKLDLNQQWVKDYFTAKMSSATANTAKNAGTFMLIDAGPDRIFGTQDDIIVGAGGGQ